VIVNDRILAIAYSDLMPILERRVAKEVFNCLTGYAADPQNNGRYPWAADITASAGGDYSDMPGGNLHGRLPDTFNETILGLGGALAATTCGATLFYACGEAGLAVALSLLPPLPGGLTGRKRFFTA